MGEMSDFLFSGNAPASVTTMGSTNTQYPDWFNDSMRGLLARSSAIAGQPYETYGGPRIAPLNDMENRGIDTVGKGAQKLDRTISSPFNQQSYKSFLDPYLKGANSEISSLQNLATQNLTEHVLPAVNDGFIANGMFGNASTPGHQSLNDVTSERAIRDSNTSLLQAEGSVLNNAYGNAMSAYQTGRGQDIGGAATLSDLGGRMIGAGGVQQAQQQQNYDLGYGDWQAQRDAPKNNADWISSILHGMTPPTSTTAYGTRPTGETNTNMGSGIGAALGFAKSLT